MFTRRSAELLSGLLLVTGCTMPATPSPTDRPQDEVDAGRVEGPRGSDGEKGTDGKNGVTGPAGAQGETGADGQRGAEGERGATGPAGATGPRGPTGAAGPAGATGPQGPVGLQGPMGLQGPQGEAGLPGTAGADGAPATTDGTRLKAIYYTSADGLKAPFGQYWDVQLETVCMVARTSSGDYRCLPRSGVLFFADPECSVEAVMAYAWGVEGSTARFGATVDGVTTYRNVTLGDEVGGTVYAKSGVSCVEYTGVNSLEASGYQAPRYVVGAQPDSAFMTIVFTYD